MRTTCKNLFRDGLGRLVLPVFLLAIAIAPQPAAAEEETKSYWYASGGSFNGTEQLGTLGEGRSGVLMGGGFGQRFNRYFAGEAEIMIAGQEYRPPGLSARDDLTMTVFSVLYSLKATISLGRVRPFIAAGLGLHLADLQIIPNGSLFNTIDLQDDRGILGQLCLGFDVTLGQKSRIGLEYREINAEADFGTFTGGDVDIGGGSVLVVYRRGFGRKLGQSGAAPSAPESSASRSSH